MVCRIFTSLRHDIPYIATKFTESILDGRLGKIGVWVFMYLCA